MAGSAIGITETVLDDPRAPVGLSDEELLERVLGGDPASSEEAFRAVVSRHGPMVRMTVRDKAGNVVNTLTAAAGDAVSGAALFLTPGAYTVSFTAVGSPLAFGLLGDGISDPIGPVLTDPTLSPDYTAPGLPGWFLYPDGTMSNVPYLFSPIMLA
jgi:hypothetical protein